MLRNLHLVGLSSVEGGKIINGPHSGLRGDCSGLRGDCTGLRGDCTGLRGNIDQCGLTEQDRVNGVEIKELVAEPLALKGE